MELKRFGKQYCRREDASQEWEILDENLVGVADLAELIAEEIIRKRNTENPPRVASVVIRSERNEALARKLGLNAAQLADRLARSDYNQGTTIRVPDGEFDAIARELGLDPQEARNRFAGRY